MKMKKCVIIIGTMIILILACGIKNKTDLKYLYAGIVYGSKNEVGSGIFFSKDNGFYKDSFYLNIYAPSEEIYYTLDGSEPTKESLQYTEALLIEDASKNENVHSMREDLSAGFIVEEDYQTPDYLVDKCTTIKVAYYDKNGVKSNTEERVYFVGFDEKRGYENVNIITVTCEPSALFSDEEGIYVLGDSYQRFVESGSDEDNWGLWGANYRNRGRNWEREANIHVFNENRENVLSQKVGIRIQGGISRAYYPKSLNFFARDEYGDNRMRYDFWGTGYYPKRMTLTSGGNDYKGKMLDRLVSELTTDCDFATMHYEPYILFLNGEYWGFYYLTEKYDEQYLEYYYDVDPLNIVAVKKDTVEIGEETDLTFYTELCEFLENSDMTLEENYRHACELLDMESLIDYFAAEIYIARKVDWPNSNFTLWRVKNVGDREYEDGKWRWMLFDVNTSAMKSADIEHDTIAHAIKKNDIFENLWDNETFQETFAERLNEISEKVLNEEKVLEKIEEYKMLMYEPMQIYHQRFFGEAFEGSYPTEKTIKEFAQKRAEYIPIMLEMNMAD